MPAFAVGRTQDLMYHLAALQRAGRLPRLPKYLDSPMAIDATEIYRAHPEDFDAEMRALLEARPLAARLGGRPDRARARPPSRRSSTRSGAPS